MRHSKIICIDSQKDFWRVVRKCLHEFHDASPSVIARVRRLRQKVEGAPLGEFELFFHREPFDTACGIAKCKLKVEDVIERYLEIRDGDEK
jgi:hypothetical protein